MNMKTAFFAEDEPLARDVLRDAIYAHPSLRLVGEAADGASALERIERLRPEVVFMDIQMPEMTGLEVLRRLDYLPQIVFTTAYDQYAVTAFELNAVDYLLKPFTQARFAAAVGRLLEGPIHERDTLGLALAAATNAPARLERILVRDRGRIFPLAVGEIEYMKSDSKYTVITARGQNFLVRIGISELEAQLDPARFVRIHRSTLVNLDFVESMRADEQSQLQIHMRDGTVLGANRDASKLLRDMAI
ncbi:LytR/AlgR family response regulator transcription factor [Massilia yuzhufengensis]|uniref:Two component transcriptional regulator, LytTR family n=1 Tax=Massilia yuzhufengensis TaxID=1164594 RepID=A0A1I1RHU3_9BURK|nr:LytTR family DNA-binding domain-containing protein [Massilia yuzhufengensis]SFD33732.1 two component transcriptional regulator, LytTR family [Massilia yuzhufengensis]